MRYRTWFRVLLAAVLSFGAAAHADAGTTGRISGHIHDAATGAPLPNANITILETTLGAASVSEGQFFVLNVPAGVYSVMASVMGYKPAIVENVLVVADFTTEVAFRLTGSVVAVLEPVRTVAERPLIQRDATSTIRVIEGRQYANLPTRGYQEAAAIQSGVVGSRYSASFDIQGNETTNNPVLFIRGGRANEVAYYVDGFSQQDPLTGYSTTSINTNAVDQVIVMTGGFNAEYGRIMSGAVNVVTKGGAPAYFGTIEAVTDNMAGSWIGTHSYDYNVYALSVGGPVVPGRNDMTFFASGERRWQGDRSPRSTAGGMLPGNSLSGFTWQGKGNWRASPATTLKLGALGSRDNWREYIHNYLYIPEHMPRYEDRNDSYFATLTHNLSPNTYMNVSVNYFLTERESGDGVHFNDLLGYGRLAARYDGDGQIVGVDTLGNRSMDRYSLFWAGPGETHPGRVYDNYLHRKSSYVGFAADATHRWSNRNTLKAGGDFQRHTLRYYHHLLPSQAVYGLSGGGYDDVVSYGYDRTGQAELNGREGRFNDGAKNPVSASLFAQNRYEYSDFVVNAGLRYDHLASRTDALANPDMPFGGAGDITLDDSDLIPSKSHNKLSPRLGIGFPVSEATLFHANYGKFYQQPNLEDLYTSYRYLEYKVASGGYFFPFGNPNLLPETTTAYEVGLAHAPAPNLRIDVTAYYKDVKDLVEVQNIPSRPRNFASYRNADFGTIKGVDFNVQMLESGGLSGSVMYSLSYARGTGSISDTHRDIAWATDEETRPPKQTAPLAFDQRHKIVLNADIRGDRESGPRVFGVFPLENTGLNLLLSLASGFPYTPIQPMNEVSLAAVSSTPTGPVNSKYGPWNHQLDAKLNRGFRVGDLFVEGYIWVLNLFDTKNEVTVYQSTGSAATSGWLATQEGRAWAGEHGEDGVQAFETKEGNPIRYGIPRMVRFGLKTSF